jgi:hypothetical protein
MNLDNVNATLAYIEANPGKWNQNMIWHSPDEQQHCFIGIAHMLATGVTRFDYGDRDNDHPLFAAAKWLEIDVLAHGEALCKVWNTLDNIRTIFDRIKAGEEKIPNLSPADMETCETV